jgi:hypothetical protein
MEESAVVPGQLAGLVVLRLPAPHADRCIHSQPPFRQLSSLPYRATPRLVKTCLASPCLPSLARPGPAVISPALPNACHACLAPSRQVAPCPALSGHACRARPCPAQPCLAQLCLPRACRVPAAPSHVPSCRAEPFLPRQAKSSRTRPRLACRATPSPDPPCHAAPCPALPAKTRHARPSQAFPCPAEPSHDLDRWRRWSQAAHRLPKGFQMAVSSDQMTDITLHLIKNESLRNWINYRRHRHVIAGRTR